MNDRDLNISLLLPNVAVLILVAIGLLSEKNPLVSGRPSAAEVSRSFSHASLARLWQDPLAVKPPAFPELRDEDKGTASPTSAPVLTPLKASLEKATRQKDEGHYQRNHGAAKQLRALVLPVMVTGDNYPEDRETRLRTRYAVLSALARAQYVPVTPDRLQFSQVRGPGLPPSAIPFEEFEVRYLVADRVKMTAHENYWRDRDGDWPPRDASQRIEIADPYDRIFVLWLDERILFEASPANGYLIADNFALRLETIITALAGDTQKFVVDLPPRQNTQDPEGREVPVQWEIKVLGPSSSDKLLSLVEQRSSFADSLRYSPRFEATILSPRATAAAPVLQISGTRQADFRSLSLAHANIGQGWKIERTISTDDRLAGAILDELEQRAIKPDASHHLVLIGEWDTLYSRGLARNFAAHLGPKTALPRAKRATWSGQPDFVHEFSYLRGLDGKLGASADDEQAAGAEGNSSVRESIPKGKEKAPPDSDHAAGPSQFDYLRRLEGHLRGLQRDLDQRPGQPAEISAIGIIGSDVYDKLLVLRALKGSFPRALFFTTDLDASYLDRVEAGWTNNLVVVSPFGFSAKPGLQDRIPPFRDSYQTALFLTALKALGVTRVGQQEFKLNEAIIQPRVFELGRTRYFDLSRPETGVVAQLHPPPTAPWVPRENWALYGLVATCAAAWGLWLWYTRFMRTMEFLQVLFGFAWLIALAAFVA
ncbi:MAG TPA: hypothetical protein VM029_04070, partial [Opitutaceae bacterium]|nr:hypothetical protein [Opitutaceae bacterium]